VDSKFLGYQCVASFALHSSNLDDVQQLLVDLVAAGAHEIEWVEFDVTAKPELRAQARRQAVKAARNKAELYAEAAGSGWAPSSISMTSTPRATSTTPAPTLPEAVNRCPRTWRPVTW
jgi:uncharacterized protein YggE